MNSHQSIIFLNFLSIPSCWSHPSSFHYPRVSQQFMVVLLLNLGPFSIRFMVQASGYPLNCLGCEKFFSLSSEAFQECFRLDSPEAIISEDFFFLNCHLSFSNYFGASSKYSLVSSWSLRSFVSKSSQISSFVFYSSRWFILFSSLIFISYGGSFKIPLPSLSYHSFILS
jgi:hypothetical protein